MDIRTDPPLRPLEARSFLWALGLAPERIPTDLDEAAARYLSMVARRRLLVVVDNANNVGQVRPLLPAAPGCLGRPQLAGLVAMNAARSVILDLLPLGDAVALLGGCWGSSGSGPNPRRSPSSPGPAATCRWPCGSPRPNWYLRTADAATALVSTLPVRLDLPASLAGPGKPLADHTAPLAWFNSERANLVATIRYAAQTPEPALAWLLADVLRDCQRRGMHVNEWIDAAQTAIGAPARRPRPPALGSSRVDQ